MEKRKQQSEESSSKKRLAFIDILIENYERGEIDLDGLREEVDTFMFEVNLETLEKILEIKILAKD